MQPIQRGRVAARDGTQIAYAVHGRSGPTLIFANGYSTSTFYWDDLIAQLAGEARMITWDLKGHGRSEPAPHARFRFSLTAPASLWQVARPARQRLPRLALDAREGDGVEALGLRTDDLRGLLLIATSPARQAPAPIKQSAKVPIASATAARVVLLM